MSAGRSLIVGAGGQVGAQMLLSLGDERALPTSREPREGWLSVDLAYLSEERQFSELLDAEPLDAIYCVAGMTNVEACEDEPELAHAVNTRGPAVLAGYARRRGLPFVYFSTEYVFDGLAGPYSETDATHAISVYGQSKLGGELAVRVANPHSLVLRTTVVYGADERHKNYLYSLIKALAADRTMKVPRDQVSTPTYNKDLVRTAVELVRLGAEGIFHVCGPELLSRSDFAERVAQSLGLDTKLLLPMPTAELGQRAPRPLSAGLRIDKLERMYPTLRMRPFAEAFEDCSVELSAYLGQQKIALHAQPEFRG